SAERQHPLGEEVGERRLAVQELLHMRDEARAFHGEDEIIRRLVAPTTEARRRLEGVKGTVDLDGIEDAAGIAEFAPLRQALGIEGLPPSRIEPAGNADSDHASLLSG